LSDNLGNRLGDNLGDRLRDNNCPTIFGIILGTGLTSRKLLGALFKHKSFDVCFLVSMTLVSIQSIADIV
jgi:hypothetical protein